MPKKIALTTYFMCTLAVLFYVYDYFIQVAPAVITTELMRDFHITASGLGLLGSCFFFAYASMQIPAGILLDKWGVRKLLSVMMLLCGFAVILFATTQHYWLACVARGLIGFTAAFSFISALHLAAQWIPATQFAIFAGIIQLGGCIGSMLGGMPLASFINHYGWRSVLGKIGLITLIMAPIAWFLIRDKTGVTGKEQFTLRAEWSRIKLLLGNKQVWFLALVGFFAWVPVSTLGALWGVPYFMQVFDWSNTTAASFCALFWLGLGLGSPLMGWLSEILQSRKTPFLICFSLGIVASIVLITLPNLSRLLTGFALLCLGFVATSQSLTFAAIRDILPRRIFGTAAGIINMAPIIGGAIAQQVVGSLLARSSVQHLVDGVPTYATRDFQHALIILPIAALAGLLLVTFKLRETYALRDQTIAAKTTEKPLAI